MSEPQAITLTPLNPCDEGHGVPRAWLRDWVDPEACYLVTCPRCGAMAAGPSPELAQALWNDEHAERDLTAEEQAGLEAVTAMDEAIAHIPRQYLCDDGVHIIQKLPDGGTYACAQCGLGFREYAEITLAAGTRAGGAPR
jgi:hypothetical protein